jgi:cobalamin synthase
MLKIIDMMSEKFHLDRVASVALGEMGMSYEEKGAWVYLTVVLGTYGAYIAVILGRADGISLTEVAYVTPMLWLIGISIALNIVGRVVVETAKPSGSTKSDVRDKDINRLGGYIGGIVLAVAMAVPFGLAMATASQFWIANAMYAAFVAFALASTLVRIVAYRRGV